MKRNKRHCHNCMTLVSLSNFVRHQSSKACSDKAEENANGSKWDHWQVGDNQYQLPCGYIGTKIACRNKLTSDKVALRLGKGGNFSAHHREIKKGQKEVHNKGKETSLQQRSKLSLSMKKHIAIHGPYRFSEETKKLLSEKKKKLYLDHPEKHPNSKLAGNRNKMTYPEKVALDWFARNGIDAKHNQRVDRFYPDFTVGNIIVEIDGERWHSSVEQKEKDSRRDKVLESLGYQIHRIPSKEHIETRLQEIFS